MRSKHLRCARSPAPVAMCLAFAKALRQGETMSAHTAHYGVAASPATVGQSRATRPRASAKAQCAGRPPARRCRGSSVRVQAVPDIPFEEEGVRARLRTRCAVTRPGVDRHSQLVPPPGALPTASPTDVTSGQPSRRQRAPAQLRDRPQARPKLALWLQPVAPGHIPCSLSLGASFRPPACPQLADCAHARVAVTPDCGRLPCAGRQSGAWPSTAATGLCVHWAMHSPPL